MRYAWTFYLPVVEHGFLLVCVLATLSDKCIKHDVSAFGFSIWWIVGTFYSKRVDAVVLSVEIWFRWWVKREQFWCIGQKLGLKPKWRWFVFSFFIFLENFCLMIVILYYCDSIFQIYVLKNSVRTLKAFTGRKQVSTVNKAIKKWSHEFTMFS